MAKQPGYGDGTLDDLVGAADNSVKDSLSGGRGLSEFLASIDTLEESELDIIVEQAIKLLEGFYVHLPMKRAMHAVDPLQRLRLLRRRIPQLTSEIAFHHEMTDIFTSLRDLHTNYILPTYLAQMAAFLPFRVEAYFENGARRYIVAQTTPGFRHLTFVPGVRLTYWNGIPIERAVEIAASYHAGSNPAARHARGVEGLTRRAMNVSPPPNEEWVMIGYEDNNQQPSELRADWTIVGLPPEDNGARAAMPIEAAAAFGLDLEGDTFRRINKILFAQHVVAAKRKVDEARRSARVGRFAPGLEAASETAQLAMARAEREAASSAVQGTESTLPDVFSVKIVPVDGRDYGYIRIATFNVYNDVEFVDEFLRLIELPQMPRDGLIIDVRGNGGGLIYAGERLLQLLTPRTIEPCRLQFINTPANLDLCRAVRGLKSWLPSLERAFETGATFSAGYPITSPERCNDIGQRYYGRIVLITDARCYSTTDIFAAGFQDHKIGTILGTDDNTGAGGANVWTLDLIREFFQSGQKPPPISALPKGASMRVAIRRTLRIGDEAGTELEDLGVKPDVRHPLTRDDMLNSSRDLIEHAARLIAGRDAETPGVGFVVTASRTAAALRVDLNTLGVDYVDVLIDGRPRDTRDLPGGQFSFEVAGFVPPTDPIRIEVRGYRLRELVCSRRLTV